MRPRSVVVVANRLPVDDTVVSDGATEWRRSPNGLLRTVHPSFGETATTWVGWAGGIGTTPPLPDVDGIRLRAVPLSECDLEDYYEGFANSTLWPLYHDAVEQPVYHRSWWEAYQRVNQRFAAVTAAAADTGSIVWIQDYHLQLVPAMLRAMRPDLRIGFFMHVPFPPPELFMQLPRRTELLRGLLGADLVGFQGQYGVENFTRLARRLLNLPVSSSEIDVDGREVRVGAFPMSIDVGEVEALATTPEVVSRAAQLRNDLGDAERVILAVDRLDYTKGIEHRLKAYSELLADGLVKVTNTVMVQVAVPSRERVAHYQILRDRVEREVGRINGDFGHIGHPAVHYLNQTFTGTELAALYRAADVMAVTPLRDGMNLVAKEFVAARVDGGGRLILSEFAGASAELTHAYLVNPQDLDGLKGALLTALDATPEDASARMAAMRRQVKTHDVRHWARSYLTALRVAH